jgi:prolipoprotein diacylglyceryltransferase
LYQPHAPGRVFALMMIVEGPSRFLLELLRVEPPVLGQMSLSMVLGIGIFAAGVVLWIVLGIQSRGLPRISPLISATPDFA